MSSTPVVLFPQPQSIEYGAGAVTLAAEGAARCSLVVTADPSALELQAAYAIRQAVGARAGVWPEICTQTPAAGTLPIWIGEAARPYVDADMTCAAGRTNGQVGCSGEAYRLVVAEAGLTVWGAGGPGTFYSAQTLAQLMQENGTALVVPAVVVTDWPQLRHRGLFIECKWGPDLMQLDDWRRLIDEMAALKMNYLGIGIYGCWCIQYEQQITEFLFVPLPQYPDLQTRKNITYYSAQKGGWQAVNYVPPMFSEDFLGEVVAYGQTRHVTVRPQFNSLGHNTLIPRLYPEISAKDAQGRPKGYGFCLTNPRTREMVGTMLTGIAERYLLPHGVDHFHIGFDEVYPVLGIYKHAPQARISPWCECPECAKHDDNELAVQYVLDLVEILQKKGVKNVTLWHDQLERTGLLNEDFVQKLAARGLKDTIILDWWRYRSTPFETTKPELGLRRFITPLGGYWHWSVYRDYLVNIETMGRLGVREGVEGIEAYSTYDRSFDNHQRLIADCGWNIGGVASLGEWKEKYARYVYGPRWQEGRQALAELEKVSALESPYVGLVINLDSYKYTYPAADKPYPRSYPQEVLAQLAADPALTEKIAAALGMARQARSTLAELAVSPVVQAIPAAEMLAEAWRIEGLLHIFHNLALLRSTYHTAQECGLAGRHSEVAAKLGEARQLADEALQAHHQVALVLENTKLDYLLPQTLRDWSAVLPFLQMLAAFLASQQQELATSAGKELAALPY